MGPFPQKIGVENSNKYSSRWFQPIWNLPQPGRGENKKYMKPPSSIWLATHPVIHPLNPWNSKKFSGQETLGRHETSGHTSV